jgi:hypothetical protein
LQELPRSGINVESFEALQTVGANFLEEKILSNSRKNERGTSKTTRSFLVVMMVAIVSLFAVGCGSDNNDFVATGTNNGPGVQTGTVTLQFAKAQTTVPQATASVVAEFFDAAGNRVFGPQTDAFANTIAYTGVPTSATNARITSLDAAGNPIATSTATFTVIAGGNVTATSGATTPVTFTIQTTPDPANVQVGGTQQLSTSVTFSNGTVRSDTATGGSTAYSGGGNFATVSSPGGLVTGVAVGNTQVVATFGLNGVSVSDTVVVSVAGAAGQLVANPSAVALTNATTSQAVTTTFNGQTVTATGTLSGFTGGVNATNLTFSSGTVSSSAAVNGTANLNLSFTPAGGTAVNTTVPVTVTRDGNPPTPPPPPGTPARLVLAQPNLVVQSGNTATVNATYFPANSTIGTAVPAGTLTGVAKNPMPAGSAGNWNFNSAANQVQAFAPGGAPPQPSNNDTVEFTVTFTPAVGAAVSADLKVTAVTNGADPRLTAITSSQLVGASSLTLPSGTVYPFIVINTAGNGTQTVAATGTGAVGAVSIDPATSPNIGTFSVAGAPASNTLTAAAVPASGNVVLRRVVTTAPLTFAPVATVNVNVTNTTLLAGGAPNVILTPSANSVKSGTALPFKIEWLFQDNTRLDVTPFYSVTESDPPLDFILNPVSGLSNGFVTADPGVAAVTPATIAINAIIGGVIAPPAGTVVTGPTANINVTP